MLEISILDFGNDLGDNTIFWSSHVMCQVGNLEKFMGAKMGGWIMKDGKKPSEMVSESRDTSSSLKNMWKRNTVIKSTQTWWCKEEWSECQHQECDPSGRNRDNGILLSKKDMSPSAWEILCVSCGERTTTSGSLRGKRMKRVHLSFATNQVLELLNMLGEYVSKSFKEVEKWWWISSWCQTLIPGLLHACDLRDRGGGDIKSDWASWVGKPCLLMFKLDLGNGPEDSFRYFLFVTNVADFLIQDDWSPTVILKIRTSCEQSPQLRMSPAPWWFLSMLRQCPDPCFSENIFNVVFVRMHNMNIDSRF